VDIQEFIESGAIESYVLGLAAQDEIAHVEQLRKQYPEVQKAISDFEDAIELQATANAIPPPAELKNRIFNSLSNLQQSGRPQMSPVTDELDVATFATPVISMKPWRMLAAASVIALIASAALNIYFYNRYSNATSQYQALLIERNSLQASNNIYQTRLDDYQLAAQMMANPDMAKVTLKSVAGKEDNLMTTVFWDKNTKDVYLLKNKLPVPTAGKQYQLWALVDGKPVDAGMLDPNCEGACKMKNIPKAQGFAITLEQKGGSPSPTMDQMFVLGTV
jgi:anti-sigma-K factor RskA